MDNIVLLLVCLLLGIILRASDRMPDAAPATINAFVIHVSLPSLILSRMHTVQPNADLIAAVAMPWIMFTVIAILLLWLGRALRLTSGVIGALILTAGLGNTSFVGLPMIELFFGAHALPIGILIDQLGSYLVLGTLGIGLACFISHETMSPRAMAIRVIAFPPVIALVVALMLIPVDYPFWVARLLARLGDTLVPLALVSVGLQLRLGALHGNGAALTCGLGMKLVVAPAVIALVLWPVTSAGGEVWRVSVFEAAMGPSIGGAIIAQQYKLGGEIPALMIGLGIPFSLLSASLWWWFALVG